MLATLVGCNYAGTSHELRGCMSPMRDTLVARFGFMPSNIAVLPTSANIKRALADMVAHAAPGRALFFHYSGHDTLVPHRRGHGTLVPHRHGQDARQEEAIVPCDFNLITDVGPAASRVWGRGLGRESRRPTALGVTSANPGWDWMVGVFKRANQEAGMVEGVETPWVSKKSPGP